MVAPATPRVPDKVVAPATPRYPVLDESTKVVNPVTPRVPDNVVAPVTPRVPDKVVAPATPRVPDKVVPWATPRVPEIEVFANVVAWATFNEPFTSKEYDGVDLKIPIPAAVIEKELTLPIGSP